MRRVAGGYGVALDQVHSEGAQGSDSQTRDQETADDGQVDVGGFFEHEGASTSIANPN